MGKTTVLKELGDVKETIATVKTDVAVLKEKFLSFEKYMKNLDKTISGNGQPGLIQKIESNENRLDNHLISDTDWKGKKDGAINGIKWIIGVGFSLLAIAVTVMALI